MYRHINQIVIPRINVEFDYKDIEFLNTLIEKSNAKDGVPTDNEYKNKCPACGYPLVDLTHCYCANCGQRIRFTTSDVIPFTKEDEVSYEGIDEDNV